MNRNALLEAQLDQYFPAGWREHEAFHSFLDAVSESYDRQEQACAAMEAQKQFFEQVLNQIPADISVVDAQHRYRFVNPTAVRNPEIREWIIGKTDREYRQYRKRPMEESEQRMLVFNETVQSGTERRWEEKILTTAGTTEYHLRILYPVFDPAGAFSHMIIYGFNITDRIEAELALKLREEKYRSIIANMNLGLVEVDDNERVVYANQSFCEMSGYRLEELLGRHAPALFLEGSTTPMGGSHIMERRKRGISDTYELEVSDKSGARKWWMISGAPVLSPEGELRGSIGIHLDITVQKMLEFELRKANANAEQSVKAKELFLANISHEIRTPMNAILGISKLLGRTEMSPQQRFYMDTIRNAGDSLQVIINDLLDFSKIEAGRITFEYIGFDLQDLVRNAISVLKYRAEEKGLAVSFTSDPAIADVLVGDPYRINQVLMNLLSNAIKFTEQGKVSIGCTLLSEVHQIQEIAFRIEDTGIGISEEFIAHLFDKFAQEDESVTRKFGGTGLGMSITKQLIELMGGQIRVDSRKNEGTVIMFTLKLPAGSTEDLPDTGVADVDLSVLSGARILLAEDNEMNRFLVRNIMAQYGAVVTEAEDGSVAIAQLQEQAFDLVLMDIQMPVRDGLEATRYIRAELDPDIPIIALTAHAFREEEERCFAAGMNDFVSKPFDEEKMVRLLAQWLRRRRPHSQPNLAGQVSNKLYDLSRLRDIGRGDLDFLRKMLQLSIDTMPETMREIQEALARSDWAKMAALAHRVKPSVLTLEVQDVADDLLVLEGLKDKVPELVLVQAHVRHLGTVLSAVVEALKLEMTLLQ